MQYQKINFNDTVGLKHSKFGGLPWLDNQNIWPSESGLPFLFLLSIESDFIVNLYPDIVFPDDCCISVFVCFNASSRKCVRQLAIHEESETSKVGTLFSKVILHKRSLIPCIPPLSAPTILTELGLELGPVEFEEVDKDMPDRGTIFSKLGGIPGWAQDPISIPGYKYVLQISELDFWQKSPIHAGLLGGDIGFLFLKQPDSLGEVGVFFIQFS